MIQLRQHCMTWSTLLVAGMCCHCVGCSNAQPSPSESAHAADSSVAGTSKPLAMKGVENALSVCDGIFSGGQPQDDDAFADIARRGVKTIVSVDGARPDVAAAKRAGLQYVHIPFGYDGIPEPSALAIVRVIRERPGPYFFHCHHGNHRGPAAAAIAAMAAGKMDAPEAARYLKQAGTGAEYAGLWRDVEHFKLPAASAKFPELAESVAVESLTAAMVNIDHISDNLKLCEKAGWKSPADHSDVAPPQQALLLKEAFREATRQLSGAKIELLRPALVDAEKLAATLEDALKEDKPQDATTAFARIQAACKACHAKHRN